MTSTREADAEAGRASMKTAITAAATRLGDIGSMVGSNTPMARRFRFAALLALLLATAAGVSACGGGSDDQDANALLKATFGPDQNIKSGRLSLNLAFDGKGLKSISGPVSLKVAGPFQTVGKGKLPKLDISIALSGGGANFSAGAVTTGDKGWLKLQGTSFVVDDQTFAQFKQGYEQASSKNDGGKNPSLSSLGVDPLRWLKDPKVAGTEEVGGAETEHITAGIDVGALLDDVSTLLSKAGQLGQTAGTVPGKLTDQQRKDIEASVKDAKVDVWTGKDDKALRRLKLDVGIDVPQAVRPRAGGLTTGTLVFDLTIADLNQPQEITGPKNARPLSQLQQLIAGGATGGTGSTGASGSAGSASGGGSAAPTTTAPSGSSEYLDCIAAAGSDVAKIQKCATLAGQ
jgi:hypothetical protein